MNTSYINQEEALKHLSIMEDNFNEYKENFLGDDADHLDQPQTATETFIQLNNMAKEGLLEITTEFIPEVGYGSGFLRIKLIKNSHPVQGYIDLYSTGCINFNEFIGMYDKINSEGFAFAKGKSEIESYFKAIVLDQ